MAQKQRGRHPKDDELFHPDLWGVLRTAASDLACLKTRGYADTSSLKLVGDRFRLNARQRAAIARSSCSDSDKASRNQRQVEPEDIRGKAVWIDGFNLIITVEAAIGGRVLLLGLDGCLRDMSSMHGNYRLLDDTLTAIRMIHRYFEALDPSSLHWLLDKPVSNSGRLKGKIEEEISQMGKGDTWEVELLPDPDVALKKLATDSIAVSADSGILNECGPWFGAARAIVSQLDPPPSLLVDFRSE